MTVLIITGYYGPHNIAKVKIVEPNKGKHIAVAGDINTIVVSKEDTGGTYSFIEAKVSPGGGAIPHIQTREQEEFYGKIANIVFPW